MPKYTVVGQDTNTASTTVLYFVNGASNGHRLKMGMLIIGSDSTPGDQASEYMLRYVTDENATPGGTAVTPRPLDKADPASFANAVEAPSGEPTYTGTINLLMIGLNQRATFRWDAAPGDEFVSAVTEDEGFGLFVVGTTSAHNINVTMRFEE